LFLLRGEVGEGGGGNSVGWVEVVHGVAETIMKGGDEGDGGAKPSSARDMVSGVGMKAVTEEFMEAFTGLKGNVSIVNREEVIRGERDGDIEGVRHGWVVRGVPPGKGVVVSKGKVGGRYSRQAM
jgi:hypothetical protein